LHLDPRVKTSALELGTLNRLTKQMYDGARSARAAADEARALAAKLDAAQGPETEALKKQLADALTPAAPAGGRGGRGGGRGGGGGQAPATNALDAIAGQMMAAAMAMQGADVAPTAREAAACAEAQRQLTSVMAKWTAVKTAAGAVK